MCHSACVALLTEASICRIPEIILVAIASCSYVVFRPFRHPVKARPPGLLTEGSRQRSGSPGQTQSGSAGSSHAPSEVWDGLKGHVWGTDDRNYRECPDDGAVTGLLFGPLISGSLLLTTLRQRKRGNIASALPDGWLVETPLILPSTTPAVDRANAALEALMKSRRSMLSLSTVVTLVLLLQLLLSRRAEMALILKRESAVPSLAVSGVKASKGHYGRGKDAERDKERERWWVPRNEWTRTIRVVGLAFAATIVLGSLKAAFGYWNSPLWRGASRCPPTATRDYYSLTSLPYSRPKHDRHPHRFALPPVLNICLRSPRSQGLHARRARHRLAVLHRTVHGGR